MKLEYTLTLADYRAAIRLHMRQRLTRQISFAIWFVIVPITAVTGLVAFIFFPISHYTRFAAELFGAECGLIWLAVFLPIMGEYQIRKFFKRLFPANRTERDCTLEIADEYIISTIPGYSEGKFYWSGISGLAQDEKITLIIVATKRFLFIPTKALSSAQRTELNDLVARHVAARKP
ncbi:MAG TPA: YcxB family protein [Terracidiphilus sp.]